MNINTNDARFLALLDQQDGAARFRDFQSFGLNDKTTKEVLERLLENGYIAKDESSESRPVYRITQLGSKVLGEHGRQLLEIESAKDEVEFELLEAQEHDLSKPSWKARVLAHQEFEKNEMRKVALTLGGYGMIAVKRQLVGPLKGVEGAYADWLTGLLFGSVDYERLVRSASGRGVVDASVWKLRLKRIPVEEIRWLVKQAWLMSNAFVDEGYCFDYPSSFDRNRKLLSKLKAELARDKSRAEIWENLRKRFEAECTQVVGRPIQFSAEEETFPKLLGWSRCKERAFGIPQYSKIWKGVLLAGLVGCGYVTESEMKRRISAVLEEPPS